jgi:hypothetical protein
MVPFSENAPEYLVPLVRLGVDPSVVYRIDATPEPPLLSVADRLTDTPLPNQPEHGPPLHAIVDVGGVVSIWISAELTGSELPALSYARYLTVVVALSESGPVYVVPLEVFGVEPSVV